jgi:hypothetical protein
MTYQSFPMQYPAATMGLIPVELDIEGLYEDHDRRRRKNGNEKTVSSHVHSVNNLIGIPKISEADPRSADELRIELRNGHSGTERRNTCESLKRD